MKAETRVINFVSAAPNIGNYTPVLGIERLLGDDARKIVCRVDCRLCTEIRPRDYDVALVGGAGLFHACFEGFWTWLARQDLPIILWGIGVCQNYDCVPIPSKLRVGVCPRTVRKLSSRIVAANVRDALTAELYDLDATVGFCPTLAYLRDVGQHLVLAGEPSGLLLVEHPELTSTTEGEALRSVCQDHTDNIVRGDVQALLGKYVRAAAVVTTRLHGAIIANCLGRPYVALARDKKVDAYREHWGGGVVIHNLDELPSALEEVRGLSLLPRPSWDSMHSFAANVKLLLS